MHDVASWAEIWRESSMEKLDINLDGITVLTCIQLILNFDEEIYLEGSGLIAWAIRENDTKVLDAI